jgi:hypothetical protein
MTEVISRQPDAEPAYRPGQKSSRGPRSERAMGYIVTVAVSCQFLDSFTLYAHMLAAAASVLRCVRNDQTLFWDL